MTPTPTVSEHSISRLRRAVLLPSAALSAVVLGALAVWTLAEGGAVRDLAPPCGGVALALAAEWCALNAAIARVGGRLAPDWDARPDRAAAVKV